MYISLVYIIVVTIFRDDHYNILNLCHNITKQDEMSLCTGQSIHGIIKIIYLRLARKFQTFFELFLEVNNLLSSSRIIITTNKNINRLQKLF